MTRWMNWALDNLLPVWVRDSRLFMGPLMRLALGPQWAEFAQFKERAPALTYKEIDAVYARLSSSHLPRATDLHVACVRLLLSRVAGTRVLDVGCGRGYLANLLQEELGVAVVGLDIFTRVVGDLARISYCAGRADRLPFADQAFDTVICTHTLEHVVDPGAVIRELRRVTRQRLIIVVPRQRPYRYTFDLHLHFFPYTYSLDLLMGVSTQRTKVVGGDLYYEEDVT